MPHNQVSSHFRTNQSDKSINDKHSGDNSKKNHPKPDKNKDLLINDIQGQNAKSVFLFNCSRSSIFMESTFGDFWKNSFHGIRSIFRFHSSIVQNITTVCHELTAQKEIDEVHLNKDVNEIEDFTNKKSQCVCGMCSTMQSEILDNLSYKK